MAETTMFVFGSHGRIAHLLGDWYGARQDPGGANRCETGLIVWQVDSGDNAKLPW